MLRFTSVFNSDLLSGAFYVDQENLLLKINESSLGLANLQITDKLRFHIRRVELSLCSDAVIYTEGFTVVNDVYEFSIYDKLGSCLRTNEIYDITVQKITQTL